MANVGVGRDGEGTHKDQSKYKDHSYLNSNVFEHVVK